MKKLVILLLGFVSLDLLPLQAQTLQKATGGSGAHKESIWWLDFEGLELAAGSSTTQSYNINGLYTLVVTIDNISFAGNLVSNTPLANQRLKGYTSGTYGGDGLVKLYNQDVPNGGASETDRDQNTLFNALTLKYDGNYSGTPNEAKANFRVKAYAYLNGSSDPLDVGLVFADAETDEPGSLAAPLLEYSQGTTNGNAWQVFEKALQDADGWQRTDISNAGLTAKTICGFNGFIWNPGNVVLLYTKKVNTTSTAPLLVDMEFKGGGRSATAIGFLLTGTDKGDAPTSYGIAENIFFTTVLGGIPPGDGTYYISNTGTEGGTPVLSVGTLGYLQTPRLGALAGDPDNYTAIIGTSANLDNLTGINDEDALSTVPPLNTRNNTYALTFAATPTPSQSAYINAWVDFNQNGVFDAAEFQSTTITSAGNVTLNWTGISPKAGVGYVRLRIQSNVPGLATGSFDIKMGGETEDYMLNITTFISGSVYHDADGLFGTPSNTINGSKVDTAGSAHLYISLLDNLGNLITQVPVNPDGTYLIPNVPIGNYTTVLTTVVNGLVPHLPTDWVNTGENMGIGAGNDGNANGIFNVIVLEGDIEKQNINFGIQQPPNSDSHTVVITQPIVNDILPLNGNGNNPPLLSGIDPEDEIYQGNTGVTRNPRGVIINTLPTNGELRYNGVLVTSANLSTTLFTNPSLFSIKFIGSGYTQVSFNYSFVDAAGSIDPSPAQYKVEWASPLPVKLLEFTAVKENNIVALLWSTISEDNNLGFDIERSKDSKTWSSIGFVPTKNVVDNANEKITYQYIDTLPLQSINYYRLKQSDIDGKYEYSMVRMVKFDNENSITVRPNPASQFLIIDGLQGIEIINIYDAAGRITKSQMATGNELIIDLVNFNNGMYYIQVIGEAGSMLSTKFLVVK